MSQNKYLVLIGERTGITPIFWDELEFTKDYVNSTILKPSYRLFDYKNLILLENPNSNLEITGVVKKTGQLIRGNAVITALDLSDNLRPVAMNLKLAELARDEILIVSKLVHKNGYA